MTTPHPTTYPEPFFAPGPKTAARSRLADFARWAARHQGAEGAHDPTDYQALYRWSVTDLEGFWAAVWEYFAVDAATEYERVLAVETMPGARWFPGATLNYAHHALRNLQPDAPAITALDETGRGYEITGRQLRARVASVAATLRDLGVGQGDRVVGYLPNTPHAVIAFLATASVGAVWSVCGQDYAPKAAADRFAQLEPTVLITADGYLFNGTTHDRRAASLELASALPTLKATVLVEHVGLAWPDGVHAGLTVPWEDAATRIQYLTCVPVPFDHPLWIVFSSGTTGLPKGIVHGHGGVLLEHLKTLSLHTDLGLGDRLLWYTTTHWMMWNLVVSTLLTGAATCTYDGSPAPQARPDVLWELAARHKVTVFGTSPQYLLAMAKLGIQPSAHDLSAVRVIGCTGSALPASAYPWVRDHVGADVQLASTSGGTDIVSGFAGSAPTTPVWAGELSAPNLGVALAAYDAKGTPVLDRVGELVVTRPMPSMPLYFWNDPDGSRYRDAYFTAYPGLWRHGDWITLTSHGSVIVHGRSDATLNRNGVRLGSADIHDIVEHFPEITEALVIGAEEPDGGYWMPLFVVPAPGVTLDDALRDRIRDAIRAGASPRHVPDEILAVPAIPHTRTGKKLEVPVKRLLQGSPTDQVLNPAAVDNPDLVAYFARLGAERRRQHGRTPTQDDAATNAI